MRKNMSKAISPYHPSEKEGGEDFRIKRTKSLNLPLTKKDVLDLHVGEAVLIKGRIFTGRDKLHKFLYNEKPPREQMPFDLKGAILYHCGPIVRKAAGNFKAIACGPTTSMRVEMYTPWLISQYGLRGVMGKGGMGRQTLKALQKYGCVYLSAIGGASVYLAERVKKVVGVWKLEEFGMTEAMWTLHVENFPAIVTMDAYGKSLHEEIQIESQKILKKLTG